MRFDDCASDCKAKKHSLQEFVVTFSDERRVIDDLI
jgi:hypothetical protein